MSVPPRVYVFLAIGLAAASQSGNLIRLGDAHPVAIAAWRLLLASLVLAPLALRGRAELGRLGRAGWGLLGLSGLCLALHFFTWITAVQTTTVANAATFFSVSPVFTAIAAHFFFGERFGIRLAVSIAVGLAGVLVVGLPDFSLGSRHLAGDGWALLCAVLGAGYLLLGKRLRQVLSTPVYAAAVYFLAAVVSFACLFALGLPALDYSPRTWLCFGLMALVPTVIGHTGYNHALRYLRAGWVSTASLTEPLLAGAVAYLAWDEAVTVYGVAGYLLICASVLVLVTDRAPAGPPSNPSPEVSS